MHYVLYALTLLISSSLLFVVQPMVAKLVQPVLGGTPAVWNTAMVFFQALLLGGYLYAHLTTKWLGTRRQAVLHMVVLAIGLLFLPIGFEPPGDPATLQAPILWLLGTLLIGVGWPFFVISTSAPLLQKWFSTIDHRRAADPYHLYAASNVGSFAALLAYPFLIEPRIGLGMQTTLWAVAYGILCASLLVCAIILWRSPVRRVDDRRDERPPASAVPLTWRRRGRWILWAFVPSSMMLGVTTFITTDVAPMPLLWIPPLAVYLLSFVIVFARRTIVPAGFWTALFPVALLALVALQITETTSPLWAITAINFGGLLIFCMVFHGLLAADRPDTEGLTEFYLWMSVGGVLGGSFNALLAPVIFDQLLEYSVVLILAAILFPVAVFRSPWARWVTGGALVGGAAYVVYVAQWTDRLEGVVESEIVWTAVVLFIGAAVATALRPRWVPIGLALLTMVATYQHGRVGPFAVHQERSFFGTHRVHHIPAALSGTHSYLALYHGTTMHGTQYTDSQLQLQPISYYAPEGPLGDVFEELDRRGYEYPIGVVGLGTGGISAYSRIDRPFKFDFYEIDPAVVRIARNTDYFTYLHFCGQRCQVIVGDGRLQLQLAEEGRYMMLVMDAYSSTAIPVHLLTREAIEMYFDKLHPRGFIAFHISNRHLDLEPLLTRIADELGYAVRFRPDASLGTPFPHTFLADRSDWLLMARDDDDFGALSSHPNWYLVDPPDDVALWTDDYANLLDVLR